MKRISAIALIIFLANTAMGQDMIFTLNYNWGSASGDLGEFITEDAYRGGGFNYTRFLESNENIGIGLGIDWQGFYEKTPRSTFPFYDETTGRTNSDITAVQFRYLYVTPILASIDYYFVKESSILPYIGINAGTIYTEQELNVGAFSNRVNTAWDLAAGGEAGLHLVFGESGVGANVSAKYTYTWYKNTFHNILLETNGGGILTVGAGISFLMLR